MIPQRMHVDWLRDEEPAVQLTSVAILGGLAGCLGAVQALPNAVLLAAIMGFVLIGPGSLVMSWFSELPFGATYALVPVVGLSLSILIVSGLLMFGLYAPLPILLAMAVLTLIGGALRRRRLVAP